MNIYTITHPQCVQLFQNLHKAYDQIIDQKKIWLCKGFEPAINEYTVDTVIQLIDRTEDGISLNVLFADKYYQQEFENMLRAIMCSVVE